ncbi:MAG TPA: YceI family protein [Polyangiaceae bacterium]|nr:YceI family protein [Polyangiaceae bacterium]
MKACSTILIGALVVASAACNTDPAKDKPKATVSEPAASPPPVETSIQAAQPATPAAAAASAQTLVFDEKSSRIDFVGAKVTSKHDGKFNTFRGTIQNVDNDPTKSSATVEIDLASLTADDPKLTQHLKSPDFFDVAKYPKAIFKTTSIKPGGEAGATHTVTGNLELHGVTKQIAFPAKIKTSGDAVQVEAEFAINRKDFGITYPGMANDLIKDDVLLKLKLNGKKA